MRYLQLFVAFKYNKVISYRLIQKASAKKQKLAHVPLKIFYSVVLLKVNLGAQREN